MTISKLNKLKIYQEENELLESDESFLCIKKNFQSSTSFPFANSYGVLCDVGDNEISSSGYPLELIKRADFSENTPTVVYEPTEKIVCFMPIEYSAQENLLTVIKSFNKLPFTNLIIYATHKLSDKVSDFINDNITIINYHKAKELTISTNIILTFGYCARSFISQKIPTIIIGPFGLGGWVTPNNINYLLRENFRGRAGGNKNEIIPIEILVDEFMEIREHKELNLVLNINAKKLKDYLSEFQITTVEKFIDESNFLYQRIKDSNTRNLLVPKLPSNVKIIRSAKTIFVQRDLIGDILFSLPQEDSNFIEDLNLDKTCLDIQRNHDISYEEFWEVLLFLWNRKGIIFI
tara:strand:- start:5980 stop:7026 length:1047 start_codon:yes stop_codon:yes gene_type:complete